MRKSKNRSGAEKLELEAQIGICPNCGSDLVISRHRKRYVETLDGLFWVLSKDRSCPNATCDLSQRYYRPMEEYKLALDEKEFGLDILLKVGEYYMGKEQSLPTIHRLLREEYGVNICQKTVGNLLRAYMGLCTCVDGDNIQLQMKLRDQGGIILLIDGVQFDDRSAVLYILRDYLSGEVLYAERMPLRGSNNFVPLLEKVKELNVPILGVVSDKEKGLVPAIQEVFPGVPYQWCQFHYLSNLSKPMESDLKKLGQEIREKVKEIKELRKKLLKMVEADQEVHLAVEFCELAITASKCSGKMPLEPSSLKRYQRLQKIRKSVRKSLQKRGGPWYLLRRLRKIFTFSASITTVAKRLQDQVEIIRKIAHILKSEHSSRQIKRVLRTFSNRCLDQIPIRGRRSNTSLFIEHVVALSDRYWEGLFHCYDSSDIPNTNNKLESDFGSVKRAQRKVTGKSSTAGGVLESCAEAFYIARSLVKFDPNLHEKLREIPFWRFKEAMKKLRQLQEPARKRRSFQRHPDSYLNTICTSWLQEEDEVNDIGG